MAGTGQSNPAAASRSRHDGTALLWNWRITVGNCDPSFEFFPTAPRPARLRSHPRCRSERPTCPELRAIQAVARYGTIKAAARELCLSPHTIDAHLDRLRQKSGLRHLPQLVAWVAMAG